MGKTDSVTPSCDD